MAAAAAFLERSGALTADPRRRAGRILAAAEMSLQAGDIEQVSQLLSAARLRPLDDRQRARADALRGHVAFVSGDARAAVPQLLKAARIDPPRAREIYLDAYGMAAVLADQQLIGDWSHAVREMPAPERPGPMSHLLDGVALLTTEGMAAAAGELEAAAEGVVDLPPEEIMRWGWFITSACYAVWDNERCLAVIQRHVRIMREAGAIGELVLHLNQLVQSLCDIGDLAGAADVVAEAETVSAATGRRHPPFATMRLMGLQGREAETAPLIRAAIDSSIAGGFGTGVTGACWTAAVLYNGHGRYDDSMRFADVAAPYHDHWLTTWMLPEVVEAASRSGAPDRAREALERLAERTGPFGTDYARGIEARARALLTDDEELYREAVERLGRTRLRPDLARAHLLYGEWLRRARRRVDAREQLRTAYGIFAGIGMEAFAERARRELLATGETVRKRTAEAKADAELTAQERQIAHLVRDGLSNPEVGARLFLSPRTVEWHLRKIFGKLGVSSRRQLRDVLPR
jgi:DNA-binding CsgD family transcriptional regulator